MVIPTPKVLIPSVSTILRNFKRLSRLLVKNVTPSRRTEDDFQLASMSQLQWGTGDTWIWICITEKVVSLLVWFAFWGSLKTEKPIELVHGRLSKFNLDLDTDIVGTITDGASVMMKFGRDTTPLHIACLAHAIHLCICDVLYRKKSMTMSDGDDISRVNEVESDQTNDDEDNPDEVPDTVLVPDYHAIVAKFARQSNCLECPLCAMMTICNL